MAAMRVVGVCVVAWALCTASAQPGPPPGGGGRIDKSTHACSKSAATNAFAWLMEYLPVEEAADDCRGRTCTCGVQSRVALKGERAGNGTLGMPSPGFGIHCTYAAGKDGERAAANGGTPQEQVEQRFAGAIGDWSTYDTDPNARAWASYRTAFWAKSGLDWYVNKFKADGVKTHVSSWQKSQTTYWSLMVLVPGTPVVLQLLGSCNVCGGSSVGTGESAEQGYLKEVFIGRGASDLDAVKTYYKDVLSVDPVKTDRTPDGDAYVEFEPIKGQAKIRYFKVDGQSGNQTTEWFQKLLLDTASEYQTSPGACWPIWGDFHYGGGGIGGRGTTILSIVTAAGKLGYPYRSFAGSKIGPSNAYVVEPSGYWIQVDGPDQGLPKCGGFDPEYCYTMCSSSPAPAPAPAPAPSGAHCDQCSSLVGHQCGGMPHAYCMGCAEGHKGDFTSIGCDVDNCPAEVAKACGSESSSELVI